MADTLFDDDDDDFWIEDPYGEADDLAEHTMQSPVLVNWDPSIELEDGWTDWEYYSDDFWDEETPKRKRRRVVKDGEPGRQATARKKRRVKAGESIPELSLGEPATSDDKKLARAEQPVVWMIRGNSQEPPTVEVGMEERVSILKDWRERFKPKQSQSKSKTASNNMSERGGADFIEQQVEEEYDEEYDDNHVFYEEDEDGETLHLPAGPTLPHDVRSMLQNQLLNLSDLSDPDDQIEDHTSTQPTNSQKPKRKPSISPDPAPEPISPPPPPSSKLPKDVDQASNNSKAPHTTDQAVDVATQHNGPTYHKNTENLPPTSKRRRSASPEPQLDPVPGNGKRIKLSTHPGETSAEAKGRKKNPKGVSRKRKTPPTNEKEQESMKLKAEASGRESASAEKDSEESKAQDPPAEKKAKSPVKKGNTKPKPKATVPERRSTRRK
ncbi:MAG: hypothetical protein LQ350_007525 [Teloschistes chrysophthalmus]|nr:MAG: hypothetical protein LQ350_007525 [Niorma chrysophthalma]